MALGDFYGEIGGDLSDVKSRLITDERVEKFVRAYAGDPTFPSLAQAFEQGDAATAFRAAHTLKGIGRDLGFTALRALASELTEALRQDAAGEYGSLDAARPLYDAVREANSVVMAAMPALDR